MWMAEVFVAWNKSVMGSHGVGSCLRTWKIGVSVRLCVARELRSVWMRLMALCAG